MSGNEKKTFRVTDPAGLVARFETEREAAQYIVDNAEAWDEYDEVLDEECEMVQIMGMTYGPAEVLKRVDPLAYRCSYNDWMDYNFESIAYELEEGERCSWFGFEVSVEQEGE